MMGHFQDPLLCVASAFVRVMMIILWKLQEPGASPVAMNDVLAAAQQCGSGNKTKGRMRRRVILSKTAVSRTPRDRSWNRTRKRFILTA